MTEVICPQCGSSRIWRDAKRYDKFGFEIQRWSCRNCGLRFSDPNDAKQAEKALQNVDTVDTKPLKRRNGIMLNSQICVTETKNLEPEQTSIQQVPEKLRDINGKLVQFAWKMQQDGYAKETIRMSSSALRALVTRGANLSDPTSVKDTLARENKWSQARRRNVITAYTLFAKFIGLSWEKPKCVVTRKFPFIPLEKEIDDLISGSGQKNSTFLQLLKETAMRCGEAKRLQWIDIDFEKNIITLNDPEKNSNPRMWRVTPKLIGMLNMLPRASQSVFGDGPINSMKTTFLKHANAYQSNCKIPDC